MKASTEKYLSKNSVVSTQYLRRPIPNSVRSAARSGSTPSSQARVSPSILQTRSRCFWGVKFDPSLEVSRLWSLVGIPLGYIVGLLT